MLSAKWQPFYLGLNVLNGDPDVIQFFTIKNLSDMVQIYFSSQTLILQSCTFVSWVPVCQQVNKLHRKKKYFGVIIIISMA